MITAAGRSRCTSHRACNGDAWWAVRRGRLEHAYRSSSTALSIRWSPRHRVKPLCWIHHAHLVEAVGHRTAADRRKVGLPTRW